MCKIYGRIWWVWIDDEPRNGNQYIEIFMIHMEILRYIIFCGIVSRYILSDMWMVSNANM